MSLLSEIDREKRDQFLRHAAHADSMALHTHGVSDRETWDDIARSYRDMADRITRSRTICDNRIEFACPYCGQIGEVVRSGAGENQTLVHLSSGFHIEEGRFRGAKHVVICNACDEIDPQRIVTPN